MEYKIISVQTTFSDNRAMAKLTQEVNAALAQGWEPLGGLALTDRGPLAQAMIRRR